MFLPLASLLFIPLFLVNLRVAQISTQIPSGCNYATYKNSLTLVPGKCAFFAGSPIVADCTSSSTLRFRVFTTGVNCTGILFSDTVYTSANVSSTGISEFRCGAAACALAGKTCLANTASVEVNYIPGSCQNGGFSKYFCKGNNVVTWISYTQQNCGGAEARRVDIPFNQCDGSFIWLSCVGGPAPPQQVSTTQNPSANNPIVSTVSPACNYVLFANQLLYAIGGCSSGRKFTCVSSTAIRMDAYTAMNCSGQQVSSVLYTRSNVSMQAVSDFRCSATTCIVQQESCGGQPTSFQNSLIPGACSSSSSQQRYYCKDASSITMVVFSQPGCAGPESGRAVIPLNLCQSGSGTRWTSCMGGPPVPPVSSSGPIMSTTMVQNPSANIGSISPNCSYAVLAGSTVFAVGACSSGYKATCLSAMYLRFDQYTNMNCSGSPSQTTTYTPNNLSPSGISAFRCTNDPCRAETLSCIGNQVLTSSVLGFCQGNMRRYCVNNTLRNFFYNQNSNCQGTPVRITTSPFDGKCVDGSIAIRCSGGPPEPKFDVITPYRFYQSADCTGPATPGQSVTNGCMSGGRSFCMGLDVVEIKYEFLNCMGRMYDWRTTKGNICRAISGTQSIINTGCNGKPAPMKDFKGAGTVLMNRSTGRTCTGTVFGTREVATGLCFEMSASSSGMYFCNNTHVMLVQYTTTKNCMGISTQRVTPLGSCVDESNPQSSQSLMYQSCRPPMMTTTPKAMTTKMMTANPMTTTPMATTTKMTTMRAATTTPKLPTVPMTTTPMATTTMKATTTTKMTTATPMQTTKMATTTTKATTATMTTKATTPMTTAATTATKTTMMTTRMTTTTPMQTTSTGKMTTPTGTTMVSSRSSTTATQTTMTTKMSTMTTGTKTTPVMPTTATSGGGTTTTTNPMTTRKCSNKICTTTPSSQVGLQYTMTLDGNTQCTNMGGNNCQSNLFGYIANLQFPSSLSCFELTCNDIANRRRLQTTNAPVSSMKKSISVSFGVTNASLARAAIEAMANKIAVDTWMTEIAKTATGGTLPKLKAANATQQCNSKCPLSAADQTAVQNALNTIIKVLTNKLRSTTPGPVSNTTKKVIGSGVFRIRVGAVFVGIFLAVVLF